MRTANRVLIVALVSYLLIILDISVVLTGLPEIREAFGLSPVALSWVQNAYLLCFGAFLLLAARAGDALGRKRTFLAGLAVFTLASLVIGVAPDAAWLIAARAGQGLGAAILAPSVLALISTHFAEGPDRERALARYALVAGAGTSLGLLLGGYCAGMLSWRVGFLVNVPVGLFLGVLAWRWVPETVRTARTFDLPGAITATTGMFALVFGIARAADHGWGEPFTALSLTSGLGLLALFVAIEARSAHPMIPLRLFGSARRSGAYVARALFIGSLVGFFFFTTQHLQQVLGLTPLQAGLAFLPVSISNFVAALWVPALSRRIGHGSLATLAMMLIAAGLFWLASASSGASSPMGIAIPMVLIGIGNGLGLAPLTVAGVSEVREEDHGAASGVVNAFHQLGGSLGLGILVVVFAESAGGGSEIEILSQRVAAANTGAAVMSLVGALVCLTTLVPTDGPRDGRAVPIPLEMHEERNAT